MWHINIDGSWFEVQSEVLNRMRENYDAMISNYKEAEKLQTQLTNALEAIKEYQLREQTARDHPTKDMRMAAWEAKKRMFSLVAKNVLQTELLFK